LNGSFLTNTDLRFKLYIFNRMGQEVYVGNSGWNGTYDNKPVDPGAYYYVLKFDSGEIRKAAIEVVKE
jgi:gliding motility-associated-like protein